MSTDAQQFEPVYRSRPGADAMRPAAAEQAEQIAPGLWCSPGLSNSYLLTTGDGPGDHQHRDGLRGAGAPRQLRRRRLLAGALHHLHAGPRGSRRRPGQCA